MFCPECGAPNEDDAVYCGNCGAPLDPDAMPSLESDEQPETSTLDELDVESFEEAPDQLPEEQATPAGELSALPALPAPPKPPPLPPPPVARTTTVQTSGMAITSLVMGILGWTFLPVLGSILAIVFGYAARREIRQRPDQLTGDGLAIAGLVLGWIMVGLSIVGLCLGAFGLCFLLSVSSSAVGY